MQDIVRLTWRGHETVETVQLLLLHATQIEIFLPQDYNHILFQTFHPLDTSSKLEINNLEGGPELLENIAGIEGLKEFSELIDPLAELEASVHVFTPPAVVILIPRERILH